MPVSFQVAIDCRDPAAEAAFWAEALGYVLQPPPPGFATWDDFLRKNDVPESQWNAFNAIVDPQGTGPRLFFQQVPESKETKTPVHLDLNVGGGRDADETERRRRVDEVVARLVERGATLVKVYEERGERWVAMRDPEGIEFDVQ